MERIGETRRDQRIIQRESTRLRAESSRKNRCRTGRSSRTFLFCSRDATCARARAYAQEMRRADFRRSRYPWLIYSLLPAGGLRWTDNKCRKVKSLDQQTVCRRDGWYQREEAPLDVPVVLDSPRSRRKEEPDSPPSSCSPMTSPFFHAILYMARKWRGIYTCAIYCLLFLSRVGASGAARVRYRIMRWLRKQRYPVSPRNDVTGTTL